MNPVLVICMEGGVVGAVFSSIPDVRVFVHDTDKDSPEAVVLSEPELSRFDQGAFDGVIHADHQPEIKTALKEEPADNQKCRKCKGDLESFGFVSIEGSLAIQEATCGDCGATMRHVYALVDSFPVEDDGRVVPND